MFSYSLILRGLKTLLNILYIYQCINILHSHIMTFIHYDTLDTGKVCYYVTH